MLRGVFQILVCTDGLISSVPDAVGSRISMQLHLHETTFPDSRTQKPNAVNLCISLRNPLP